MVKEITLEEAQKAAQRAEDARKKAEIELAKAHATLKDAKTRSFQEAVGRGGEEVKSIVDDFLYHRKKSFELSQSIDKLIEERAVANAFIIEHYKPVRDALTKLEFKEEFLDEQIGAPPQAKAAKAAGKTGDRKHQNLYNPAGEKVSWVDYGMKNVGLAESELRGEGINARRVIMEQKKHVLPKGWTVVEE